MADDKQPPQGSDDWLSELEQEGAGSFDQLDQSDIDQLLASADLTGKPAPGGAADIAEAGALELDQEALDALLSAPPAEPAAEAAEIHQPDASAAPGSPQRPEAPMDQASLEALLGSDHDDFQAALADDSNVPSQSDIDQLFAQAQNGQGADGQPADDFDLEELFAVQDNPATAPGWQPEAAPARPPAARSASPAREEADLEEDIFADEPLASPLLREEKKSWRGLLSRRPRIRISRRLAAGTLAAALLLGSGIYLFSWRDSLDPEPTITSGPPLDFLDGRADLPVTQEGAPGPPPEANSPPVVRGAEYQMPKSGGEVPLLLFAQDKEGDNLTYEITVPPSYGRLTGPLPTPLYLPNNNFPGTDSLEFRVSDGLNYSDSATILITGPNLRPEPRKSPPESRAASPAPAVLQANHLTLKTSSTRELVIDWKRVWQQANQQPYSEEITVEVVTGELRGRLQRVDQQRHRYVPDRLFSGRELIEYRFRKGAASSKYGEIEVVVELGDNPPEIKIRGLEDRSFQVGETVVLDASATRDDDPETLRFEWQQLTGTPVRLEQLNEQGSLVSFVVPSSFYTEEDPGPVLHLSVIDRSGQRAETSLKIPTRTRRHSALWPGSAPGRADGALIREQRLDNEGGR